MSRQVRRFKPPLQQEWGHGILLSVSLAGCDDNGGTFAKLEVWNGDLLHQGRIALTNDQQRRRFARAVAAKAPALTEAEVDRRLMRLEAPLTERLDAPDPKPGAPSDIHLTDMGNGARFAQMHCNRARYCLTHGWLVYDGKRWKPDPLAAVELAKATVRRMYGEAAASPDDDFRKALGQWACKSEENNRIQAMLALARSEAGIKIDGENLDQQPWLFNVANGTINLRTGELEAHDPAHLITQLSPVAYDPKAPRPCFDRSLLEMMGDRTELVDYLQRWLGHCLSGSTQAQEMLFFHGMGANGKNTLVEIIQRAMGEYATMAPQDLLVERKHEPHTQEIASLMGKRLVVADETEQGRRFNEAQLKRLTGSGQLKGHFMRQNDITFWPQFKVVLMANHKPIIRGTDDAIWRRPKLVPFDVKFHDPDSGKAPAKDTTLPERLKGELPGVLAWLVEGCRLWIAGDYQLKPPEAVCAASAAYRREMDTLSDFLAECCIEQGGAETQSSLLHGVYVNWCGRQHEPALKQKAFSVALLERGYQKDKGGPFDKVMVWKNLGLVDQAHEEARPPDGEAGREGQDRRLW